MNLYENLNNCKLEHICTGTNEVSRFELDGKKYVYKKNTQNSLGSFWFHQKELYGSCYESYIKELPTLISALSENTYIHIPKLYEYSETDRYQIFECVDGKAWDPDEFPNSIEIARLLGRYIGKFHSVEFPNYGTIGNHTKTEFKKHFFDTCKKQIELYWNNDIDKLKQLEEYESNFKDYNTFSLIMTDISGNQFIYDEDYTSILYNIDIDAYVIGPRELELFIIKECLTKDNFNIFKEEYVKITDKEFPKLENEEAYRFCLSLNDV